MKKRILAALLILLLVISLLTATVSADSGPKPGTHIRLTEAGEKTVLTLLCDLEGWGPNQAVGAQEEPQDWQTQNEAQEEAWYAFRDYEDPDGFYFLGEVFEDGVSWGYWPPETFKVAVYYPERDLLWVSEEIYNRYAFRSDYRLVLPAPGENPVSGAVDMVLKKEHSVFEELGGLAFRILVTLAVELALAVLLGFNSRKQLKLIGVTNLVTQVGLNVLLWMWYFYDGPLAALIRLFLAEVVVLIAELVVYLFRLREDESAVRTILYTICANGASVLLGFLLLA